MGAPGCGFLEFDEEVVDKDPDGAEEASGRGTQDVSKDAGMEGSTLTVRSRED